MTPSDAARATGWQVDARTANRAAERAISPGWSRADDDVTALLVGIPPTRQASRRASGAGRNVLPAAAMDEVAGKDRPP